MQELIKEYNKSLISIKQLQKGACDEDKEIMSGMASDLQYTLEWMKTGRQPGNRRGIERLAGYQREHSFDPALMQRYFNNSEDVYEWDDHKKGCSLSKWDRIRIEDALSYLTDREREVYLMAKGDCLSYSQIANYLSVSKGTVQKMIERSKKKIEQRINETSSAYVDEVFCRTKATI